jgi:aminoglycoside phosphotransferase (APT) family kinase protein
MSATEIADLARRHVPGEGTPAIRRLGAGLVNDSYEVSRDGRRYVLRVATAESRDFGLERRWECRVLAACAAVTDLAPIVECCLPEHGILVARWISGRCWGPAEASTPAAIEQMAQLLRRVHAVALPHPARVMLPADWVGFYGARALPGRGKLGFAASALREQASARLLALAAMAPVTPVLCHGDLHTLNLIEVGRSLTLLDWEYAHGSEPLWDLAGWSANNDFDETSRHSLLAGYLRRLPTPGECSRMGLLVWLYDYVCLLWSELYLNQPTVPDGIAARAQQLATRLDARR